jgi:phage terminase large subunit-like protein
MLEHNKSYVAFLEGLNEVDKAQLLFGNWDARPKGASYWERSWVQDNAVPRLPYGCTKVRAYDLAATERSQANRFPDPTACIGMAKDRHGDFYIYGHYHEGTYDDHYQVYGQYCMRSGSRDKQIIAQAAYDGEETFVVLPQDPAAAGKAAFDSMSKLIMAEGFKVKKDPMPINKSKLTKFEPFATACENGVVYIVESSFDKKTLEFIYKQLEMFNGERSTSTRKDEFPDVMASAFNMLNKTKVIRPFSVPNCASSASRLSEHNRRTR